jgi:hypothetical protein
LAKTGTRKLAFGSRMPLGGTVDVQTPADLRIWMADIQTDDVVVATYATRSVLDISLTMARQNRAAMAGGVRQDYTSTIRVEARNATKRARGSQ